MAYFFQFKLANYDLITTCISILYIQHDERVNKIADDIFSFEAPFMIHYRFSKIYACRDIKVIPFECFQLWNFEHLIWSCQIITSLELCLMIKIERFLCKSLRIRCNIQLINVVKFIQSLSVKLDLIIKVKLDIFRIIRPLNDTYRFGILSIFQFLDYLTFWL